MHTVGKRDLAGKQVLISVGGTREHLNPVRFIGNPSTGKMGLALAQAALHRGASVTLVHGLASRDVPLGVQAIPVISAKEMRTIMLPYLLNADVILMSGTVANVKPREYSQQKLAKRGCQVEIAPCSKLQMAHHLFDFLVPTLSVGMHSEGSAFKPQELQQLHIPQRIVMREPVPDVVAQSFITYFLPVFANGKSLYLAVRSARERLQGLEDKFRCASRLPVIYQNPAVVPPTRQELCGKTACDRPSLLSRRTLCTVLLTSMVITIKSRPPKAA